MKKWINKVVPLMAAVICIMTIGTVAVKADTVPQFSWSPSEHKGVKSDSGLEYNIKLTARTMSENDYNNTSSSAKKITDAGEIVFTLQEGQDTSSEAGYTPKKEKIPLDLIGTDGNGKGVYICSDPAIKTKNYAANATVYDRTNRKIKFKSSGDSQFCWNITYNDYKYNLFYTYQLVFPNEYIVASIKEGTDGRFIDITDVDKSDYTVALDPADSTGSTYVIHSDSYLDAFAKSFTFKPRYAYGASGVDAAEDGTFTTGDNPNGYKFKMKNISGEEKEFTLKIDMPDPVGDTYFLNYTNFKEQIQAVTVDGAALTPNSDGTGIENLSPGKAVVVTLKEQEGKRLTGVVVTDEDQIPVASARADWRTGSFSFSMPEKNVSLTNLIWEDRDPVVQVGFKQTQYALTSDQDIPWTLDIETRPLTEADFSREPGDKSYTIESAGTFTFTLPEGQDTSGNFYSGIIPFDLEKELSVSDGNYQVTVVGNASNTMWQKERGFFDLLQNNRDKAVWIKLTKGEITYNLYFDWKLEMPAEYIAITGHSAISPLIQINGNSNYSVTLEDNTFLITCSNYNMQLAKQFDFVPRYAYGASGVGVEDGKTFTTGERPDKDGYTFRIQNSKKEEKEFQLKIDMPYPFHIDETLTGYIGSIREGDRTLESKSSYYLTAKKEITVVVNPPEGKMLSEVRLNCAGQIIQPKLTEGSNVFSFSMPKDEVQVVGMSFTERPENVRNINVSTKTLNNSSDKVEGSVKVLFNGHEVRNAIKDQTITLQAIDCEGSSFFNYGFDHWEISGVTLTDADAKKSEYTFNMPDQDVEVTAVFRHVGVEVTVGTDNKNGGTIGFGLTGKGANIAFGVENLITDIYRPGLNYYVNLVNPEVTAHEFLGWKKADGSYWEYTNTDTITWVEWAGYKYPQFVLKEDMEPLTFIASFKANTACILNLKSLNDEMGTVSAMKDGQVVSSGTLLYEGETISLKAENKTGYVFDHWEVTDPAVDSGVEFADANAAETTFTIPAKSSLTIQAVFKEDPNYKSSACDMTKVELLDAEGKVVKLGNKSGTTFTIKLSAQDMSLEEAGKLTSGSYKLRTTTSPKSVVELEGGFKDDATATWGAGVTCPISKNGEGTFIVHAENGTDEQRYTVKITYDDRPILTAGKVKRISDKDAEITFISSSKGMYYFEVVDSGAEKPDISTAGVGTPIKAADRENKITLNTLTAGAKDIYIVVKNDDHATDVKISDTLKMSIPAYDEEEVTYQVSLYKTEGGTIALTASKGTISTADAASGKPAVIDVKAGDTVKLTVTPNSGKRMVSGSLKRSQGGAPYEVKDIDEKTMQFVMPAYDLSVSCRFEDASAEEPDTSKKLNGFMVNGINGVINDASGTVTITLPNGTDLTKLSPTVVANGAKSIVPSSGTVVDLSKPVTYTLTFEDGTTKKYTVTAYTEAPSVSDRLWEDMLDNAGGNTDHTGSRTWWEKAKKYKKNNDYPQYWAPLD